MLYMSLDVAMPCHSAAMLCKFLCCNATSFRCYRLCNLAVCFNAIIVFSILISYVFVLNVYTYAQGIYLSFYKLKYIFVKLFN